VTTLDEWKAAAREAVLYVADERPDWTSDEVWNLLDARGVRLPDGETPRRLGDVFTALQRAGLIEKAGCPARQSRRPERHGGSVAVWTSPGASWMVPDAAPISRAGRAALQAWAAANDMGVQDAMDRAVKLLTGGEG